MGSNNNYNYSHINALGTTVVSTNAKCILGSVIVNNKGLTGNTVAVYDANSAGGAVAANLVALIDTTSQVGPVGFDIVMQNGIVIVAATGTAGDLTITYL